MYTTVLFKSWQLKFFTSFFYFRICHIWLTKVHVLRLIWARIQVSMLQTLCRVCHQAIRMMLWHNHKRQHPTIPVQLIRFYPLSSRSYCFWFLIETYHCLFCFRILYLFLKKLQVLPPIWTKIEAQLYRQQWANIPLQLIR